MAARKVLPVLSEMLSAIDGIELHTRGKSFADFQNDWLLRLAIQRALEIVSEASRHIPDHMLNLTVDVPWKKVRGLGNVLRHDYHNIADDMIWSVLTDHLQPLRVAVTTMMARADAEPGEM